MNSAFLSIGFRPFYLGAAVVAAVSVPLWALAYLSGAGSLPGAGALSAAGALPAAGALSAAGATPLLWHAHEMVFGFAPAVIVGFLLTAVRNWTGLPTPSGGALGALFTLWLSGRILGYLDSGLFGMLVDAVFLPTAALTIAIPLWRARNLRNAFVVGILLALAAANIAYLLAIRGWPGLPFTLATTLALDLILILMTVIGGRVIPAFSENAVSGLNPHRWMFIEILAIGAPVIVLLMDAAQWSGPGRSLTPFLFWLAAAVHLVRLAGWQPWKTWRNPLLLALPLAYLWIPVHLMLRAESSPSATHALTVGAMASLMLAMMTRSALGHTGRPLAARPVECFCFAAIHFAAICRVVGPAWFAGHPAIWLSASTVFWSAAFGVFAVAYFPILIGTRQDRNTDTRL